MKTLQVIYSTESDQPSTVETATYRVDHVPYRGFSRGLGEFAELTIPLVKGDYPWILIQPADNELNYDEAVAACLASPYHHFGFSLSDDSHASHPHVFRGGQPDGWREVPFYDHAMFYSLEFYRMFSPHFRESKSFWGLDLLACFFHRNLYGKPCAVYCGAELRHTKPIESNAWCIDGKSPDQEMAMIRAKYGI
jgi:hypothetical protein